jgi:hypothetical protein
MSAQVFDAVHRNRGREGTRPGLTGGGNAARPCGMYRDPSALPPGVPSICGQESLRRIEDRQLLEMSRGYSAHGGLVSSIEVERRLRRHWDAPAVVLADWIVKRAIVNVRWRSQLLIPAFQFTPSNMTIHPVVSGVLAEFENVFDDWETALWFALPNGLLFDTRPVDLLPTSPETVAQAARADRFVARGG